MLRFLTAGESHGQALTSIIDGLPAGLQIAREDIDRDLARRQVGYGRGGRMQIEQDSVQVLSGLRFGKTLGSPIALLIENKDWPNWTERMSPFGKAPEGQEIFTVPRPGHVDLAANYKYGFTDLRDALERASARETAARVAAGAVVRRLLAEFDVRIFSHVISLGGVDADLGNLSATEISERAEQSPLRCADAGAEKLMKKKIDAAKEKGDSLGGVFQVIITGVSPGLGSYTQWDRKLDGKLAGALMSIPAIKGVEIGLGFETAGKYGSEVHDEIVISEDKGLRRPTNNAGGIEGGVSNGEAIIIQAAMKPIPTLTQPLQSVNLETGEPAPAVKERSDVCAVPAAGVVAEAMCCMILAQTYMEKYGSDTLAEMKASWQTHNKKIGR